MYVCIKDVRGYECLYSIHRPKDRFFRIFIKDIKITQGYGRIRSVPRISTFSTTEASAKSAFLVINHEKEREKNVERWEQYFFI